MLILRFIKKHSIRLTIITTLIIVNLILDYAIPKNGFIYVHFNNASASAQNFFKALILIPLFFGRYIPPLVTFIFYIAAQIIISFPVFNDSGGYALITLTFLGIIIDILAEVIIHFIRKGNNPKE